MDELLALYASELPEIRAADFLNARASWRELVPEELRELWPSLPDETRLAVYLTANEAYLNFAD